MVEPRAVEKVHYRFLQPHALRSSDGFLVLGVLRGELVIITKHALYGRYRSISRRIAEGTDVIHINGPAPIAVISWR